MPTAIARQARPSAKRDAPTLGKGFRDMNSVGWRLNETEGIPMRYTGKVTGDRVET
ncbi:hypothetical protein KIPB_014951, partial [Kipferlia bialata]|eukprot:g14951.t1